MTDAFDPASFTGMAFCLDGHGHVYAQTVHRDASGAYDGGHETFFGKPEIGKYIWTVSTAAPNQHDARRQVCRKGGGTLCWRGKGQAGLAQIAKHYYGRVITSEDFDALTAYTTQAAARADMEA